jgi:hypothetical protein
MKTINVDMGYIQEQMPDPNPIPQKPEPTTPIIPPDMPANPGIPQEVPPLPNIPPQELPEKDFIGMIRY